MRVLKRVLTRKSILGFGYADVRELSVQMIIDLGKENYLIKSYFGLEKIDFTEDILDELKITSEYRISKPNKDIELGDLFFKNRYNKLYNDLSNDEKIKLFSKMKKDKKFDIIRKDSSSKVFRSSEFLRSKNHGNRLK
jgi:hypothetical protein